MSPSLSRPTYACTACRQAWKERPTCPRCGKPAQFMGRRWRAPKRRNTLAWRRVLRGRVLWDDRVWTRTSEHRKPHRNPYEGPSVRYVKGRRVRGDVRLKNGAVAR